MVTAARGFRAVWLALRSRRTASVALLSFASGLPLGLVWIAIPAWLARMGVDIKIIGLFTLAQAPWSFKFLWSPFMDRFAPPFKLRGNKLGWTLLAQIALLVLTLALAGLATHTDAVWIIGALTLAIALASASQDIAIDAYAVEVLEKDEQGVAVGARIALYRAAMFVAGGLAITLAGWWSWPAVFVLLALFYVPLALVTLTSPRPAVERLHTPESLRAAVWEPFLGFFAKARALEILAFVVLYKLADNLAGALVRPFLIQTGFNDVDVGIATASIGLVATLLGTFVGGALTSTIGLGHALWLFGGLQVASNIGYVLIAEVGPNRPLMYAAMGFESLTTGMGTGAFSVLLLRLTQKEFSATQYALFSSLFALPRIFAGPVTGVLVDSLGWRDFFWFTIAVGVPGLLMLQRFSPLGAREPRIAAVAPAPTRPPYSRAQLWQRGLVVAGIGGAVALVVVALLNAIKRARQEHAAMELATALDRLLTAHSMTDGLQLAGVAIFAALLGLAAAAASAAKGRRP